MTRRIRLAATVLAAACMVSPALPGARADQATTEAALKLGDARRAAPNFVGITNWLNSGPLNIADLRGKVVLVDFWTYGCYNCVNTLPHVTRLFETFKGRDFVIIGVHTPEFPFERSTGNIQTAIKHHGIQYPVAQDNDYATWNAYHNHYWPAQYIIDKTGRIVFEHAGEGQYDEIEQTIRKLLNAES
jgi:peroxiredoxin